VSGLQKTGFEYFCQAMPSSLGNMIAVFSVIRMADRFSVCGLIGEALRICAGKPAST